MSKFVVTGPSSYKKKRIYQPAVSQRLRNTDIKHPLSYQILMKLEFSRETFEKY